MQNGTAALVAGVSAGIAGLLAFLVIHHLWIRPIWFILPIGLVVAAGGGLAVGWAYSELLPGLPARPWTILAWAALVGVTLLPALILAQVRSPIFSGTGENAALTVSTGRAVSIFLFELLLTSALCGGLAGWLIGRTGRAALAMALASLIFALGPGHNIPFLGNTPVTGKGIALLVAIVLVACVVLVEVHAALSGGRFHAN
jgi:hypothetical protein